MINHQLPLDELNPELQTWFHLIDQARRNPEGELVPSFLEIMQQIKTELEVFFKGKLEPKDVKSALVGISIISYLNEKYAIEKIMMFAKGRYRVSLPPPPELISQLSEKLSNHLATSGLNEKIKMMGKTMLYVLQKDFQTARDACVPLNQHFKEKLAKSSLSLLEAICFALLRNDIIPIIIKNLNTYQAEHAQQPLAIYFSILKNVVSEIQANQHRRKSALEGLRNLFENLSQLEKKE
ncbi:MAG: hypothetical protein HWN65_04985 [Candidatus Helarchaeota archaeon]|nr:hypothetical protein [Candidatus Helarchaeota archaeon]